MVTTGYISGPHEGNTWRRVVIPDKITSLYFTTQPRAPAEVRTVSVHDDSEDIVTPVPSSSLQTLVQKFRELRLVHTQPRVVDTLIREYIGLNLLPGQGDTIVEYVVTSYLNWDVWTQLHGKAHTPEVKIVSNATDAAEACVSIRNLVNYCVDIRR